MSDDWDDDDDGEIPAEWKRDSHALGRIADEARAGVVHGDLAMRLMRDRALMLAIAGDAPPGADRVAIAVGAEVRPPHLVVSRSGNYVATLLGAGMDTAATPIVGFDRVHVHLGRAEHRAAERAAVEEARSEVGSVRRLLERIDHAGARLSREDVELAVALAPVLEAAFVERATNTFQRIRARAQKVMRIKHLAPSFEPMLRSFWDGFHAVGHYLLLATTRGKESFKFWDHVPVPAKLAEIGFEPYRHIYLQPLMLGQGYVCVRAFAAIARAGEDAVPTVRFLLENAPSAVWWVRCAYALVAIGRRHRKLRADLARFIGPSRLPPVLRDTPSGVEAAKALQFVMDAHWGEEGIDEAAQLAVKRRLAESMVRGIYGEESLAVLGDELSFARLAAMPCNFLRINQDVNTLATAVALLAEASPEEMYFPAASTSLAPAFSPELAHDYAHIVPPPTQPARAVERPGRNDACSCGSGKKFKRCCGMN